MLTNVNSHLTRRCAWCPNVISWKHSFNRLNEEYEIAKKKQQALDGLYDKGKISQSTHDSFNSEIAAAITEIEKQQQDLIAKMALKTAELQNQIKTLEMLLANYEIQHVTGEIDDTTYDQEINLFNNGLETAKHELQTIQDAMNQICNPTAAPAATIPEPAPTIEAAPNPVPETIEVPAACPPAEVTPSYVVSAPEPVIAPVAEAASAPVIETPAPVVETPAPIPEAPSIETPTIEAPTAAPEPAPVAVIEAPVTVEQPAPVVEAPAVEAPAIEALVVETPVVETPVVEAPVIEAPVVEASAAEAPAIEVPTVEAPIVEQPVVEAPKAEVPVAETPVVEVPTVEVPAVETPADQPQIIEEVPVTEPIVEPAAVIEEAKVDKTALDAFEVSEPDVVQKELLNAVEEIAENPFAQAPPEAHEEAAKATTEAYVETQPTIQPAKDSITDAASSNSENKS